MTRKPSEAIYFFEVRQCKRINGPHAHVCSLDTLAETMRRALIEGLLP